MSTKQLATVAQILGLPQLPEECDIGIEVEVEGGNLPRRQTKYWEAKGDGSLRGESMEYVLRAPISRDLSKEALQDLVITMKENGARINESDRCGVHIHINCQNMTMPELMSFITLYAVFEKLLLRYCGPARQGNLFCLGLEEADEMLFALIRLKERFDLGHFIGDQFRYSAMNLSALLRYGSLEFRSLGTPINLMDIQPWIDMLMSIKIASYAFKEPYEIVESFSRDGEDRFINLVMQDNGPRLMVDGYSKLLWDGVRNIQGFSYQETTGKPQYAEDYALHEGRWMSREDATFLERMERAQEREREDQIFVENPGQPRAEPRGPMHQIEEVRRVVWELPQPPRRRNRNNRIAAAHIVMEEDR